jgi:hypothetical protein
MRPGGDARDGEPNDGDRQQEAFAAGVPRNWSPATCAHRENRYQRKHLPDAGVDHVLGRHEQEDHGR